MSDVGRRAERAQGLKAARQNSNGLVVKQQLLGRSQLYIRTLPLSC